MTRIVTSTHRYKRPPQKQQAAPLVAQGRHQAFFACMIRPDDA